MMKLLYMTHRPDNGAVSTCETSVKVYKATRRRNPEEKNFHARRRENVRPHIPLSSDYSKRLAFPLQLVWLNDAGLWHKTLFTKRT